MYDLRQDPLEIANLPDETLKQVLFKRDDTTELLPVKVLKPNACPAIAPLGVLDNFSQKRLSLDLKIVQENFKKLRSIQGFNERIAQLFEQVNEANRAKFDTVDDPDFQLYDGFVHEVDKTKQRAVRASDKNELADLNLNFTDERLEELLLRYKSRNFPESLNEGEHNMWEVYRKNELYRVCQVNFQSTSLLSVFQC